MFCSHIKPLQFGTDLFLARISENWRSQFVVTFSLFSAWE
ncbi:hypothetical protein M595_0416 [Lyngbya aestuarii BL J]|uniref:Uncharacterized protein n=1 Tax=Lyngbya aestuarii BL J TaxID=1348334 RepID=U7QQM4_9CYAN|nr:hypothetical protein M595_0416 [Lyngbya aestuarii BL J]